MSSTCGEERPAPGNAPAFAGQVPAGLLRALERHPDVVAISIDAPVSPSGLSTSVTGTAAGSPYTLRATLGLETTTTSKSTIAVGTVSSAAVVKMQTLS